MTLTAVLVGLGSNPREGMYVCKCIVPSRHEGTPNSRSVPSPFVKLVDGEKRKEAPDPIRVFSLKNWDEIEQNRTVTCMVLKAKPNDRVRKQFVSSVVSVKSSIDNRPSNFESRSNDENDISVGTPLPKLLQHANGRTLSHCESVALGLELLTHQPRSHDHDN
ncbi:hypothetical protein TNCV_2963901 [Trichonephila clavipes]|nr:hypothetical protein TNCV_2963901 [Trichonephila clavipes]